MSNAFRATSVEQQYAGITREALRVLVVGAGIAGVTVAGLLRRSGASPVLVERGSERDHERDRAGYMLALMPMVDTALDDLGVRPEYRAASERLARYRLHGHTGRRIREDPLAMLLARYGDYRGIGRGELLDVLAGTGRAVAYDTTVTALDERPTGVVATFRTGETRTGESRTGETRIEREFDVVIVADGIHSSTRRLVIGDRPVQVVDPGWGGWVVWIDTDEDPDLVEEVWGAGFFLGSYPVEGRLGVFLGASNTDTGGASTASRASRDRARAAFVASVRRRLKIVAPRTDRALQAVLDEPEPYYWPLTDCRAPGWAYGRTILLGDAAAGFLPTAGVGAGMAMESAWALARILRYATSEPTRVPTLLQAYERAQRPRVEAAQDASRSLARLMFRPSRVVAMARDLVMRVASVRAAIRPIQRLLATPTEPDVVAREALGVPVELDDPVERDLNSTLDADRGQA